MSSDPDVNENKLVKLRIMDKEVQLACKSSEESHLAKAAAHVDKAMRELRRRNASSSTEKIAIVVALNTAAALLKANEGSFGDDQHIVEQLASINAKLDQLLEEEGLLESIH